MSRRGRRGPRLSKSEQGHRTRGRHRRQSSHRVRGGATVPGAATGGSGSGRAREVKGSARSPSASWASTCSSTPPVQPPPPELVVKLPLKLLADERAPAAAVEPAARGSVAAGRTSTVETEKRSSSGAGAGSASGEVGSSSSSCGGAKRRAEAREAESRVRKSSAACSGGPPHPDRGVYRTRGKATPGA
eukprot:scaffold13859_cov84-Isochrysis_galbana.AAC.1